MKFRFKEFRVYKEGKAYCLFCRNVVKDCILPNDRGLADQIQRALNSILLNIAEGSADNSDAEFARFLSISIRSVYETVAGFDTAELYDLIEKDLNNQIEEKAHGLVKQLASFRTKLRS
ncbi:MAG: four helix bundle protein [Deltaproteobacteria bacterium]|nr:four helix bundle protein [Deltaproteobacteria bacterium]MBW2296672.1 four helix bundle protein [Deltaproteobacteria bacterium]